MVCRGFSFAAWPVKPAAAQTRPSLTFPGMAATGAAVVVLMRTGGLAEHGLDSILHSTVMSVHPVLDCTLQRI